MTRSTDARLLIRFGPLTSLGPGEAVLVTGGAADVPHGGRAVRRLELPPGDRAHPAACACCMPRGPIAAALAELFFARARGEVPFFSAVLVVGADARAEAAIREAVRRDPLVGTRYRTALPAASA